MLQNQYRRILKRIALVGYDSDKFLAPDSTYDALHFVVNMTVKQGRGGNGC
jgi:hypothetical protein